MTRSKKTKPTAQSKPLPPKATLPNSIFDSKTFLEKHSRALWILFFGVAVVFCMSVFKNIRYPLFWADESITAVGGQRVLKYGYPKVHDGKNVLYDLLHENRKLGIDEKTDAYVGGAAWFQYYLAAVAVKLGSFSNNIYTQTGIIRSFFASIGILGMLFFIFLLSRLFNTGFSKLLFALLFFTLCLFSISLTLILREVRYYSPNILLVCFIAAYYAIARFKNAQKAVFAVVSSISLLLLYHTFPPAYFIMIAALSLSEGVLIFSEWLKTDDLKRILLKTLPFTLPIVVSLIGVLTFLPYFRTFEIAKAMSIYNAKNSGTFISNLKIVFSYFWNFELLWLALFIKILIFLKLPVFLKKSDALFKTSLFFSLLFVVYCVAITRIPNFIYTRYFCPAILILNATILLDLFCLNQFYQPRTLHGFQLKTIVLSVFGLIIIGSFVIQNKEEISGHLVELSEPYKGPLDYTIPYIKEKYKNPENLIVATNYEETSYMYYLNSKTIVGYVGNNIKEDTLLIPDIIQIRKIWSFNREPLDKLLRKAHYSKITFPVYDNAVNNIPEFNFIETFNHLYETKANVSAEDAVDLYVRTDY